MSDNEQEANPGEESVQGWAACTLAEAHKNIPSDAKYISYQCEFKGRDGRKCTHKTAIESRKKADSQLYEH